MTVVLGYDESPGAQRALDSAIEVAAAFGDGLVIVYGAAPPNRLGEEYGAHHDALVAMGREALGRAVTAAQEAGVPTRVELVDALPVDALLQVADEVDARVIVVGTWAESPLKGAIIGSTPHKLLHLSSRPVLCVPAKTPQ